MYDLLIGSGMSLPLHGRGVCVSTEGMYMRLHRGPNMDDPPIICVSIEIDMIV